MESLIKYIILFFFYSAAGWCLESLYCSIGEKRFINRGFLTGPLCPIYGTAALVLIILIYNPFKDYPLIVFLLGIVLCDIVEFLTSLIMEKLFAARWWDYTYEFMNIQGRICLKHSLYWGVISIAFVKIIHPGVENLYSKINGDYIIYILAAILILFAIDVINAVIKASDIRKLHLKLNKLIDTLSGEFENIRETVEEKYGSIHTMLEKQSDRINEFKLQIEDVVFEIDQRLTRKSSKKDSKNKISSRLLYNNPFLEKYTRNKLKKLNDLISNIKSNIFESEEMQ